MRLSYDQLAVLLSTPPGPFLVAVGRRISTLRENLGLTQKQLAAHLGTYERFVQNVERGKNITLVSLVAFALGLKTSPEKLLAGTAKFLRGVEPKQLHRKHKRKPAPQKMPPPRPKGRPRKRRQKS